MMYVISRLDIRKQEVALVAAYESLESAIAYIHTLENQRLCKLKEGHLIKVYETGRIYNSHMFTYQVLEVPSQSD